MAHKVFIGVGHGGSDPGAVANGLRESDLNLAIALACQAELERHGVTVKISRTKNENDPLTEEIQECNAFAPDLAVDIHNNAGGGDGVEVYHHFGGGTGKTLALNIIGEVVNIGQNSRGAKTKTNSSGLDYFGFIRSTAAPAVIVECAFVDNKTDIQIIDTAAEQQAMGVAIARGILKTLGVAEKVESTGKVYRVFVGTYESESAAKSVAAKLQAAGYSATVEEAEETLKAEALWIPAEGDTVQFKGGTQYGSANADTGSSAAAGQAKITKAVKGKHPYHLVRTGKTGPYGWVDRDTFEKI